MKYLKIILIVPFAFIIFSCVSTYEKQTLSSGTQYTQLKQIISRKYVLDNIYKDSKISIEFDDTRVYGNSGVNNYFGKFELYNGNISIPDLSTTRAMGKQEDMEIEKNYYNMLMNADKLQAEGNILIITLKNGERLIFKEKI